LHPAIPIGAGALAAVGFNYLARSAGRRRELFIYALGLAGVALIYLLVALVRGDWRSVVAESIGVALFSALAMCGSRRTAIVLALGWMLHVGWDLALHGMLSGGFMPYGYRWACVGFDLAVGGCVLGRFSGK
jgi:hypothetical protein